jgi:hypothetical protein
MAFENLLLASAALAVIIGILAVLGIVYIPVAP